MPYGTAKMYKLVNLQHTAVWNLKFRPGIKLETGTSSYNITKVISKYWSMYVIGILLCKTDYFIEDTKNVKHLFDKQWK